MNIYPTTFISKPLQFNYILNSFSQIDTNIYQKLATTTKKNKKNILLTDMMIIM